MEEGMPLNQVSDSNPKTDDYDMNTTDLVKKQLWYFGILWLMCASVPQCETITQLLKTTSNICQNPAFFHLKNIARLHPSLTASDAEKLIHAFVSSGLDYC